MPDIVIVTESDTVTVSESSGSVYGVSIVSANGFAGSVAKSTTTPQITLSTTVSGLVKADGTKLSAATAGTDFVLPGGALGTPSSGTLTLCTGLPISTGISGLGTGAAAFLATPSSANLIALLTDETGTGAAVFANTPTLVTPNIGVASGTSLVLSGDLTVNGSTVTLNATTLEIKDKNIVLANVATPTEITCDGSGITVKSSVTDHTFNYVAASTAWTSSENIDLASGKVIKFNGVSVLSATALNKVTVTAPATGSTLTIVDGATLTASATANVSGTNSGDDAINSLYSGLISDKTVVLTNGTGIGITGTYPSFTVTNSAPDQTVALTAGSGVGITGTYPNFTISATGSGTVTKASVVSANGFAGTVATDTTTPALTLTTSITGLLKGDGTAISAATSGTDYAVPSGNITGTAAGLSTTLAVTSGGTGLATLTANNVILGNGTSNPTFVAPSTNGNVLTSNGTTWQSVAPAGGGGSGTVTTASVVSANGFAGSVATDTTTPAITISTSITGLLKGNGTAISAATSGTDYAVPSGNITGTAAGLSTTLAVASGGTGLATLTANNVILGNGSSNPTFVAPSTSGNVLTSNGTTWQSTAPAGGGGSGTVTTASVVSANGFGGSVATATSTPAITLTTSITGILKGNATAISAATEGTDYLSNISVIDGGTF